MTEYIEKYFIEEELSYNYKSKKLIKLKGLLVNDKKEGEWIIGEIKKYYNFLKNLDYGYFYDKVYYVDNKLNGPYIKYNEYSEIIEKGNFKDDLKNGIITNIDLDCINKTIFKNGIEHGIYISHEIDTNFIIEYGNFNYGKLNGKYKMYDNYGNISGIFNYINNKKEGKQICYFTKENTIYINDKIIRNYMI